ncbi:uncharacterized protein [Rutidosis leptorrhynchoides]|uniref:uncharacterized protein n=1 Tax=Rutidosis leptorrhynchoides TaxID=125765 RepID=UPI003A99C160
MEGKLVNAEWKWDWIQDDIGSRNTSSLATLVSELQLLQIRDQPDIWQWSLDSNKLFSVHSMRQYIDKIQLPSIEPSTIWIKALPRKLNIFLWRLCLDRLPHRINLAIKGIVIPSVACSICNESGEDLEHVFFECSSSSDLWRLLRIWLSCNMPRFNAWNEFESWFNAWSSNSDSKVKVLLSVVTFLWVIWRYRNCVVFNDTSVNRSTLFDLIRLYFFNWLKNRSKMISNWNSWLLSPL